MFEILFWRLMCLDVGCLKVNGHIIGPKMTKSSDAYD